MTFVPEALVLERILAGRRGDPALAGPSLCVSVACHLLVAGAGVALAFAGAAIPDREMPPDERVLLLLPLFPSSAPPEQLALAWPGGTSPGDAPPVAIEGAGRGLGDDIGSGRLAATVVPGAELGPPDGGGNEYVYAWDEEIDRPVVRHPQAGAPRYPPALLAAGVEGWVAAEFTVDTTGHADSASLVVLDSTHVEFALALREAVPRLRYVPAEHGGQRVRQRVAQKFVFRVDPPLPPMAGPST